MDRHDVARAERLRDEALVTAARPEDRLGQPNLTPAQRTMVARMRDDWLERACAHDAAIRACRRVRPA